MIYFLLFSVVILSGLSVFLLKSANPKKIKLLLSFSGAYLLSVSLLGLIPEIYRSSTTNNYIGLFILLGFFIQIMLEYFSKGIEHGHIHLHENHHHAFPVAVVASLCTHSFLEGMPLATIVSNKDYYNQLLIGIILHNIPISFVLMALLIDVSGKRKALMWLIIFALMLPLGATVNFFFAERIVSEIINYNQIILAIVVGIFLHISTTILFESSENHRFNFYKFLSILFGAGLALINLR